MIKAMVLKNKVFRTDRPFIYFVVFNDPPERCWYLMLERREDGSLLKSKTSCQREAFVAYREASVDEVLTDFSVEEIMSAVRKT